MNSIMVRKTGNSPARFLAGLLALGAWQLAAVFVHNRLLLVGPVQVVIRLLTLIPTASFWQAVGFTFSRISFGFCIALIAAACLAAVAVKWPIAEILLRPYMLAVQTVPVASFIVIALLWLSGRKLSIFISFLMVLPVLYSNLLQGLHSEDRKLLEMAQVFEMPFWNRFRGITLPALRPFLFSGCRSALGLCWKAGIAAEVIGVTGGSIGGMLYDAKVYLEIADLFAWTLVIIAISSLFEHLVLWFFGKAFDRLEAMK